VIEEKLKVQDQGAIRTPADSPILREESESRRKGMAGALLNRFERDGSGSTTRRTTSSSAGRAGKRLFDGSRQYVSLSLLDVAKECLAALGTRWQTKSRTEIATLAFQTSSDFPNILANVANKSLRAGYEMSDSQWKLIAARRTAPDF